MINPKKTNPDSSQPVSEESISPQEQKPRKKDLNQILKTASRRGLKPKGQQGLIDFKSPDPDS